MSPRRICFALALLLCTAPAAAQAEGPDANGDAGVGAAADISGSWTFRTGPYHLVCSMTGELTLSPTSDPDVLEGRIVAYESCLGDQRYEAHQSSAANRSEDRLTLTSTLEQVLPPSVTYLPDNFDLRIVNGALMIGVLHFGDVRAKAEFRRDDGLMS